MKMTKEFAVLAAILTTFAYADQMQKMPAQPAQQQPAAPSPMGDCGAMSPDTQAFAGQLSPSNKTMFCGKFNDSQRTQAMQMSVQKDASGKNMMTPDQAVQKVAESGGMMNSGTTPRGCPVK